MTEKNQSVQKQFRRWQKSIQSMQSRLHWHCHFMQKLEDEPAIEHRNMWSAANGLRENDFSDRNFQAWKSGCTGYPLVDACMRSLNKTGWLPFRMRALVVSFASYSLWLHWRDTGIHLANSFLDFEPGIHWSQMQMQSGTTGINTLRIYNPTKQAKEQDPQGTFIRKWIPELVSVPNVFIHTPWMMPAHIQQSSGCTIGSLYPKPIIDHTLALRQAKSRFTELRQDKKARDAACAVAVRHGSRRDRRGAMRQDQVRKNLRKKQVVDQRRDSKATEKQSLLPFAHD
jgi:deoxyribodipyrimidine photo-lyase